MTKPQMNGDIRRMSLHWIEVNFVHMCKENTQTNKQQKQFTLTMIFGHTCCFHPGVHWKGFLTILFYT